MEVLNTIQAVINTLNQVQVTGESNMDKLLGCILALKKVKDQVAQLDEPEITVTEVGTEQEN